MMQPTGHGQLGWLLDNLVERVERVREAVVLSRDGLVVAKTRHMSSEDGDRLAALASGLQSLARGAGEHCRGGEVRQTIVEMDNAFLFVVAAGQGACLAVAAAADADIGVIGYETAMLVRRMGRHLTAAPRFTEREPAAG